MKVEDIPQELVDMLDQHAGKHHSRQGPVLASLAQILTRYGEMRAAETVPMADVEAWLKRQRNGRRYAIGQGALDDALDDLREHFQTGTPLD
jgi:hypothetical protein